MKRLPEEDLKHILDHTAWLWEEMRNKTVFITGGTGFFGKWLVESFLFCNSKLGLNAKIIVLSRSPERFLDELPFLKDESALSFCEGSLPSFSFPEAPCHFIVHAAIDYQESLELFDSAYHGLKRVLDFARNAKTQKFLFLSSGAVYGIQPPTLSRIDEDFMGAPDPMLEGSAYGLAKRVCEFYGAEFARKNDFDFLIARCFAFAGPHFPLEKYSAIGNFIKNALAGKEIIIEGDGTTYRSYLYASDLTIWLWNILFKGVSCHPYNVGSDQEISIFDLAKEVEALVNQNIEIIVKGRTKEGMLPERYIPDINRIKKELGQSILINRDSSIIKMADWHKNKH